MPETITFAGIIEAARGGGACVPVPFDPKEVFGTGRSVRVCATYDGFEAKSSVVTMDGRAVLGIHKATREAINKGPGNRVSVTLIQDLAPQTVDIPPELAGEFAKARDVKKQFDALAFTYRKEFARWVAEAKRQETRDRRALGVIEKVRAGQTL